MKIAIVYNRSSTKVINLFGLPNRERIGLGTIKRIAEGLRRGGHHVKAFEGDMDLIERLEEFMPRVLKGERPGMVFNLSYGIQGQARYTHVPSILEMVGIPYVGSGPLAHSLALDKVVAKIIFRQNGIPTPDFVVLHSPGFPAPELAYPLIVKPKNEAVSFGLRVVNNERELREAADVIFKTYKQPVLAEQYIDGREINIGLLGNSPPEPLPPVELIFGPEGPGIYTYEDKTRRSGREIGMECPARLDPQVAERAKKLAVNAFSALGCYDVARVDMRLDRDGNLYVLELNSLPSMGEHSSLAAAAAHAGLDFTALTNRLVEIAAARYFGTPAPPQISVRSKDLGQAVFNYLVSRRDQMERRVKDWTNSVSRTSDPAGVHDVVAKVGRSFSEMGLRIVTEFSDGSSVWTWETQAGFEGGTLLIGHLDVPVEPSIPGQSFRFDSEWLYGDGVAVSKAPLTMVEYAFRTLKSLRKIRKVNAGALFYADEGRDCYRSAEIIRAAAAKAKRVLVVRPGSLENKVITQRRGWRKYRFIVEDAPRRPGKLNKKPEVLQWVCARMMELSRLSSRAKKVAVSAIELHTDAYPKLLPHRVTGTLLISYLDPRMPDAIERGMHEVLRQGGYYWELELISDRPPMRKRRANERLLRALSRVASDWEIPIGHESSLYPSAAGLVPSSTGVVCGVGPVAAEIGTPREAVRRISLLRRTLLLTQFLAQYSKD